MMQLIIQNCLGFLNFYRNVNSYWVGFILICDTEETEKYLKQQEASIFFLKTIKNFIRISLSFHRKQQLILFTHQLVNYTSILSWMKIREKFYQKELKSQLKINSEAKRNFATHSDFSVEISKIHQRP